MRPYLIIDGVRIYHRNYLGHERVRFFQDRQEPIIVAQLQVDGVFITHRRFVYGVPCVIDDIEAVCTDDAWSLMMGGGDKDVWYTTFQHMENWYTWAVNLIRRKAGSDGVGHVITSCLTQLNPHVPAHVLYPIAARVQRLVAKACMAKIPLYVLTRRLPLVTDDWSGDDELERLIKEKEVSMHVS